MKIRKIAATLLCLTMVVCSIPAFVFADEDNIDVQEQDQSAVSDTAPGGGGPNDEDDDAVSVDGFSLSIGGDIAVNFFIDVDGSVVDVDAAYVDFTVTDNEGATVSSQTVRLSDIEPLSEEELGPSYDENFPRYKISCNVAAKDMTSTISMEFIYDGDVYADCEYSIRQYAKELLEDSRQSGYWDLVKAMLDYGTYAQNYFNHNLGQPANGGEDYNDISEISASTVSSYARTLDGFDPSSNVSFAGANMSLLSTTTLTLFFNNQTGRKITYDVTSDLDSYETTRSGYDVVVFDNIPAQDLNTKIVVKVYDGETYIGTVTYYPLSYCYAVLSKDYTDSVITNDLKDLVRSMYIFYTEAHSLLSVG